MTVLLCMSTHRHITKKQREKVYQLLIKRTLVEQNLTPFNLKQCTGELKVIFGYLLTAQATTEGNTTLIGGLIPPAS